MHQGNRDFLADLRERYATFFSGTRVLELGSQDLNGSAREYFDHSCAYTGVDIVPGPGVDLVCPSALTDFKPGSFDVLVSLSMFEHDCGWKESLSHNLRWLREGALVILGWGAEGNNPHEPFPWGLVPAWKFHLAAEAMPLVIAEAFFEKKRYTPDCAGAYDVVAWKKTPEPAPQPPPTPQTPL